LKAIAGNETCPVSMPVHNKQKNGAVVYRSNYPFKIKTGCLAGSYKLLSGRNNIEHVYKYSPDSGN
jgi:hypothetical protein